MPDREKVIKGLECCNTRSEEAGCEYCPYFSGLLSVRCVFELQRDALELLKEPMAQLDAEAATETQEYCERYEPTYNPETGVCEEDEAMDVSDTISRSALLAAYDAAHKGPPGGARKLIVEAPAVDAVPVVHCKDCRYCYKLEDPQVPWDGSGSGSFYCKESLMDFYAPHYSAERYFCGDAKRREDGLLRSARNDTGEGDGKKEEKA